MEPIVCLNLTGTLDALMTEDTNEVKQTAETYLREISRVLRTGGRYICISLLEEHIIRALVDFFPKNNWMFRVVRAVEAEQKTAESSNDGKRIVNVNVGEISPSSPCRIRLLQIKTKLPNVPRYLNASIYCHCNEI